MVRRLGGLLFGIAATCLASPALAAAPPPPPPSSPSTGPSGPPPSPSSPVVGPGAGTRGGEGGAVADPVIDQRTPETDVAGSWGYSNTEAPRPNYVRPERDSILTINPIGSYAGVDLDGRNIPPFAVVSPDINSAVLTWTGFGMRPGRASRVFFKLSNNVSDYVVDQQGKHIVITLPNTSINVRNNRRRLDTRFFDTPVIEVKVRRDKSSTTISILLREEATPTISIDPIGAGPTQVGTPAEAADSPQNRGYFIMKIDFPALQDRAGFEYQDEAREADRLPSS